MRHLIDFGDLTRREWEELYARAGRIMDDPDSYIDVCRGKVMASRFYEPPWAERSSALPIPTPPRWPRARP